MKKYIPSIISSSIGNILEWYDFGLFSIFASLFSDLFFPTQSQTNGLIATFTIFAVGFFCRPLGAVIFGYLGDRYGRAGTLRLSILMIAMPTLLIGLIPTYQTIGIFAPILLLLVRMWQGISIGGEYSGNLIYLAETAPTKHRALITSFASTGANVGILLATLVGAISTNVFSNETLTTYGWRLPYLFSGILCILIYKFRLKIQETQVFEYLKEKKKLVTNPITTVFKNNRFELLRTLGLVCMGSTSYYFYFAYLPLFLRENNFLTINHLSLLMFFVFFSMLFLVTLAGFTCDLIGRRKLFLINCFITLLLVMIGFYFILQNNYIVFFFACFAIVSSFEQATTSITVVENFPPPARYTGIAIAYNIGNGFLGGTAPMVCAFLYNYMHFGPAIYISILALITLLVVYFYIPETKNISLTQESRTQYISGHI